MYQRSDSTSTSSHPQLPIDVIVPVYRGLDETRRCLDSLLANLQETKYELVVINDASPEPDLCAYLDDLAKRDLITLQKNAVNRGFVGAVNIGLSLHPLRDVVLLNSDTEVHGDWLDRIVHCSYAEPDIGTVTPFSNNATICSYPHPLNVNTLPQGLSLAQTDALFKAVNSGNRIEIPTGVGFCMFIRRTCLDAVGLLDEAHFGTGYGEENDFCMRARTKGWRHVLCADTYVFHAGGVSFGEQQASRQLAAQKTLAELHPSYAPLVEAFIRSDPVRPLRLKVNVARACISGEQATQVLEESDKELIQSEAMNTRLREGLAHAELLLRDERAASECLRQALGEAQGYVRERELEVSQAQAALLQTQTALSQAQAIVVSANEKLAALDFERSRLRSELDAIQATRLWKYTKFLRKK
jgi:GT2 family glycosyltransferase